MPVHPYASLMKPIMGPSKKVPILPKPFTKPMIADAAFLPSISPNSTGNEPTKINKNHIKLLRKSIGNEFELTKNNVWATIQRSSNDHH